MSSEPQNKKTKMSSSSLEQLKNFTTIVADTGDFEGIYICDDNLTPRPYPIFI